MAVLSLSVIIEARRFASATLTIKTGGWSGTVVGTIERSEYVSPDAEVYGEEDEVMTSKTTVNYE